MNDSNMMTCDLCGGSFPASHMSDSWGWTDLCQPCDDQYMKDHPEEPNEDSYSDVEADADTLASAGYGTDEDYGSF